MSSYMDLLEQKIKYTNLINEQFKDANSEKDKQQRFLFCKDYENLIRDNMQILLDSGKNKIDDRLDEKSHPKLVHKFMDGVEQIWSRDPRECDKIIDYMLKRDYGAKSTNFNKSSELASKHKSNYFLNGTRVSHPYFGINVDLSKKHISVYCGETNETHID